MTPILEVSHLDVFFQNKGFEADFHAVRDVNFTLNKGEILGIVGESGSGKSLTALSVLGLLPYPKAKHSKESSIRFNGIELINNQKLQDIRGGKIGFIFQEPMSSLNPLHTIGKQVAETIMLHQNISKTKAIEEVIRLLKLTGIPNAKERINAYPHELSGGQRQRVMIAMAIANKPDILIADEPTTALDVTIQKQIIELLLKLRQEMGMGIIFIGHDLQLIRRIADKIVVMHKGRIVETGTTQQIFDAPKNEYTKTLINSTNILKINNKNKKECIVKAQDITVKFPRQKSFWGSIKSYLLAVNSVSFELSKGKTLGVVGESGSGKTTLGLAISNLISHEGSVFLNGKKANDYLNQELRRTLQIVFQDPYNSLNPRMTIEQIIGEGLEVHYPKLCKEDKKQKILSVIKDVGLKPHSLPKYPHEFSGGQRQRIAIARALILNPQVIILDEPTSALDVTIQKQILELLQDLQQQRGLSYLFISHDMNAVKAIADEIMVMKEGLVVEQGAAVQILEHPQKEYTKQLIAAAFLSEKNKDE